MNRLSEEARDAFVSRFGAPENLQFVRAPGSVTIVGDHTLEFDGISMLAAVNIDLVLAFAPNRTRAVNVYSVYKDETATIDLNDVVPDPVHDWVDIMSGVADRLEARQVELNGFDAVIAGSLPVDAGMGASAALGVATALAFLNLAGEEMDAAAVAGIAQEAEVVFVGVPASIAPAMASAAGQTGMAFVFDARNLDIIYVPLAPADAHLVICDSRVRSSTARAEILRRREQCREGLRQINRALRNRTAKSLRDISLRDFNLYGEMLPPPVRQCVKHVVTENKRVQECAESLLARNIVRAGILMDASHASLRDDYEVSCKELDVLTEIAWNTRNVLGARMMGEGLGGSTITLVDPKGVANLCEALSREFKHQFGVSPGITICQAGRGAEIYSDTEEK